MKIFINDLSFYVVKYGNKEKFEINSGVIKDGYIKDNHYLFYIFNKYFKNNAISKREKVDLIINTSKIMFLNKTVPEISDTEIISMIKYEIENKTPLDYEHCKIRYIKEKINGNYNLDIFILEKELIDSYAELFKELKINLNSIHSLNDYIFSGKGINIIFNSDITTVSINNKDCKLNRTLFHKNIYKYISENLISIEDIHKFLYYEDEFSIDIELKKIKENCEKLLEERMNTVYFIIRNCNDTIYLNGDIIDERIINIFKEQFKIRKVEKLNYDNCNSKINYLDKNRIKIKYFPMVLCMILLINICFNVFLKLSIKNQNNSLNKLNKTLSLIKDDYYNLNPEKIKKDYIAISEKEKENSKINNENHRNKDFLDIIEKLLKYDNDNIFFEKYSYNQGDIYIRGFSKNKKIIYDLEKVIKKKLRIIEITEDGDLYRFNIHILNDEI